MIHYEDFLLTYPNISDPLFQQKIYDKKEFNELVLSRDLEVIERGEFLNHQKIIQRFLSSETVYDELLVYHETGTGKSGVAFSVTENLYDSKSFSNVYVIARGETLLMSLMNELVTKYSKRYSIPEDVKEDNRNRYMKRMVSDFYQFRTLETFSKELSRFPDDILKNRYNNSVFIIDEVQNIKSEETGSIYKQFHRLFHLLDNRKILLMSATPMRNEPNEISYIMNLLLPLDEQIPMGEEFNNRFILGENIVNQDQLKDAFRGRISILASNPSNVESKYMGEYIDPSKIETFKLFYTYMKEFQRNSYRQAFRKDTTEQKTIYANSKQASLFVFPDGSYGVEGMGNWTSKTGNFLPEMVMSINTLEKLENLSSKYAYVIDNIKKNPKKLIYIYCSIVHGSGIEVFTKILDNYGFSRARGHERIPARRYIALTSETTNINKLLRYFNSPENRYGDYCQVIIGSRKISEGFTFKNIQTIHVLTLHWNYTEIQQAVARGIRYLSHKDLEDDGLFPIVEIYQHASIHSRQINVQTAESLDVMMMQTSKEKDIIIRKINRLIKEMAFDCPLVKDRNYRPNAKDGSRECDYQACDYDCEQVGSEMSQIDYSTYHLYFQKHEKIVGSICKLFNTNFSLNIGTIKDMLDVDDIRQLVHALSIIVRHNIPIINKYGIECFLRESNNVYYLVDNVVLPNEHEELALYTKYPMMNVHKSMKSVIRENSYQHIMRNISNISEAKSQEEVKEYLLSLPVNIQAKFLETSLEKKYLQNQNTDLVKWILDIYRDNITKNKDFRIISTLLEPILRCLDEENGTWIEATEPTKEENEVKIDVEKNPYGYYGIMEGDNFCIKDIRDAIDNPNGKIDRRKIKTGSNCLEVGFNKDRLSEICLHLGIEIPSDEIDPDPRKKLEKTLQGRKLLQKWSSWDLGEISRGYYWYKMDKSSICNAIKEWFARNGLLVEGTCGKSGKKK